MIDEEDATMEEEPFKRHGAFSWCELITEDAASAKTFYAHLFGWETEEVNLPDKTYRILTSKGKPIGGGILEMPGMPAMWGVYVTVENVGQSADLAVDLGATILLPPTEIPNVGRICVIRDPQGACINLITYINGSDGHSS
jgi:predicted enzyme related to lactoylglutathione lyase